MSLPADIKYQIRDAIDSALADFNDAYRGVIEETNLCGDYGKIEEYDIITCASSEMRVLIELYLDDIASSMREALKRILSYPFTPVVEWDVRNDGEYYMRLGYIIVSDIPFLRKLADCTDD